MKRSGFTLLELLIVVAIIAILIALALPFYQDYITKSKLTASAADLNTYKQALQKYDQLESSPFTSSTDMRPLIGKYLQDFRQNDPNQLLPRDPWGKPYTINAVYGLLFSGGPNTTIDTTADGDLAARIAQKDDLMVSWKPPFFIASAKAVASNSIELEFSRPIDDTSIAANGGDFSCATGYVVTGAQMAAPTIVRLYLDSASKPIANADSVTVTVAGEVSAKDGRKMVPDAAKDDKNPQNTSGTTITFTAKL